MDSYWSDVDRRAKAAKVNPWIAMGIALVVTAMCAVLALAVWLVKSEQVERATSKLEISSAELARLQAEHTAIKTQLASLIEADAALQEEHRSLVTSSEPLKRNLDAVSARLADLQRADATPSWLPVAALADVLRPTSKLAVRVDLYDAERTSGLSLGALTEFVKQRLIKSGLELDDAAEKMLHVSVMAATAQDGVVGIGCSISQVETWKVPSRMNSASVQVWTTQLSGLTNRSTSPTFVEQLLDPMIQQYLQARTP